MKRVARLTVAGCFAILIVLMVWSAGCSDSQDAVQTGSGARKGDILSESFDLIDALGRSCDQETHSGYATYYTWADGGGNCMFDPTPDDLMVGAMNPVDYAGADMCGATVVIQGPRGLIRVRIVDQCAGCPEGSIDLSPFAFSQIADLEQGIVPIQWKLVAANVHGNILYHFKDGSNQWWTAVQVRNHRNPIARFEYLTAQGMWKSVPRQSYNYFVESSGMGTGPYTFRVTDIYGKMLVDSGIPHIENGSVAGAAQFPACTRTILY